MTNQLIGYLDCPHCGKEVSLRESKKGKVYYTCPDCGQFFARTKGADEALRAKARPDKAAPGEKKEETQITAGGKEEDGTEKRSWLDREI